MHLMLRVVTGLAVLLLLGGTATTAQADAATTYSTQCAACHAKDGTGIPGLAPALKGNSFVTEGDVQAIRDTILQGRQGAQKKYTDYPAAMPPWPLSDEEVAALIVYLRGPLQG